MYVHVHLCGGVCVCQCVRGCPSAWVCVCVRASICVLRCGRGATLLCTPSACKQRSTPPPEAVPPCGLVYCCAWLKFEGGRCCKPLYRLDVVQTLVLPPLFFFFCFEPWRGGGEGGGGRGGAGGHQARACSCCALEEPCKAEGGGGLCCQGCQAPSLPGSLLQLSKCLGKGCVRKGGGACGGRRKGKGKGLPPC